MSLPSLPSGFTWDVELADAGAKAVILLQQNGVTIKRAEVSVAGIDVEADFTGVIEARAAKMFTPADFDHYSWLDDFS